MKTAIITGASSGLGREMAKGIKSRFPEIEEDEAPYRLLCNEYPKAKD